MSESGARGLRLTSPAALVFAALVVATVGAFFVTTRLKRSAPVLEQLTFNRHFSPNGDGRLDYAVFAFRLRRSDDVTVSIVTRDGDKIRTLAENRALTKGRRHRFRWDGRTTGGAIAPDGEYHLRIALRRQGRTVTSPRKLLLDTAPPRPVVRYVSPSVITPAGVGGARSRASLRFAGPTRKPALLVYRTDLPRPRLVARRSGRTGDATLQWDGRVGLGRSRRPAPTGSYLMAVQVRDAAGNIGPTRLPPTRDTVKGHPGVEVRYLAGRALAPAAAGGTARFSVLAAGSRYRWRIRRLGSRRTLTRGSSRAPSLQLRVPRALSGLALLALSAGTHRYTVPFAVRPRKRRRVLVVLPTLTWQAMNPVDQNGDGFPDLLPLDRQVGLRRPIAGSGLARGFGETAGLLRFLGRAGLRYDIATDEAVLRAGPAPLGRYRGLLVAGPERFAPAALIGLLRSYTERAGGLAWTGTGGFSRRVRVAGSRLAGGQPAGSAAVLGERVKLERGARAITVLGDRIDFFRGVGGAFGPYPALEPSLRLPGGARLLASAGAEPRRPSLVVYRLGHGFVARVGVAGFGHSLATSADAGRIMRRLWALLSR